MPSRSVRLVIVLGALAALAGCSVAVRRGAGSELPTADGEAILALEAETAAAWNRADLAAHVAAYADSAVFMAPGPVVGRHRIRASLERSFWREGRPVQQLRYENVELRPLGRDQAIMTGKFVLSGGGRADKSGWFTLLWQRTPEGWRIVHDHSS
jgi:uncharacterized protein (TIGR02246 family)